MACVCIGDGGRLDWGILYSELADSSKSSSTWMPDMLLALGIDSMELGRGPVFCRGSTLSETCQRPSSATCPCLVSFPHNPVVVSECWLQTPNIFSIWCGALHVRDHSLIHSCFLSKQKVDDEERRRTGLRLPCSFQVPSLALDYPTIIRRATKLKASQAGRSFLPLITPLAVPLLPTTRSQADLELLRLLSSCLISSHPHTIPIIPWLQKALL